MAEALVSKADRAFVEEDYDEAVALYSQALQIAPQASVYEARANAHIKLENFLDAADDASKAIEMDPSMAKAYLRKGIACFYLEEYESAKELFEAGLSVAPSNNQFKTWIRKCQAEIDAEKDDVRGQSSAPAVEPAPPAGSSLPGNSVPASTSMPSTAVAAAPSCGPPAGGGAAGAATVTDSTAGPMTMTPAALAALSYEGKYRHQWYQLQSKVTVDVYAKKKKKEEVQVDFSEDRLTVSIVDADGKEEYKLDVKLYGKIIPAQCKYEVLSTKIEIGLTKADTVQWGSLETSNKIAAPNYSDTSQAPVMGKYPSSYTKAPKDWEKVDSELSEMEKKGELEDGDPLNNFFKKIFGQGDEDQRRAMMKSFTESNGTVLSTNWKDVGSKKVECTPPEGMVAKKWES